MIKYVYKDQIIHPLASPIGSVLRLTYQGRFLAIIYMKILRSWWFSALNVLIQADCHLVLYSLGLIEGGNVKGGFFC